MNAVDITVWRNVAVIPVIVGALLLRAVVLCREWVRGDRRRRVCGPVSVRWRPGHSTRSACAFRVVYSDCQGRLHRTTGRCSWHRPGVTWEGDEVIGPPRETAA